MVTKLPKTDVVTVGVGWTGGIIAAECSKAGLEVVGLERGRNRETQDFAMKHDELRYALRYENGQDLSRQTLTFRNNSGQRALPMRKFGSFLLGEGVGGAGTHWNGLTDRYSPYDFEIRSKTIEKYGESKIADGLNLQDWGITYEEIEPYYVKFEKMAGISADETPLRGERSEPFPNPAMKSTPAMDLFIETTKNMGLDPFVMPAANNSQNYQNPDGQRIGACQYNGFCERFGCEYGAKASPNITVIPTAEATGNFELRPNSEVIEVLHDGEKATGVLYIDTRTGERFEQPAEVVALTSYTFNNNRLLLASELGTPYNPETQRGTIGKNYCYQVIVGTDGFFDDQKFNVAMGSGGLAATLDNFNADNFDHTDHDFLHGGSILMGQYAKRPIANNQVPPGTPRWGSDFKKQSIKYFNRSINIYTYGACLPHANNYLDLDPTYKDIHGYPLLRMTFDYSDTDRKRGHFLNEQTKKIMQEMGATHVSDNESMEHYDITEYKATHNTGGVIMGEDPETSAVNSYLQMWEADNVFVVGGSAYPHQSGYNATATLGALAYRASEGIIDYSKDGGSLV
ncbi:GMC family oxidoreductase [Alteribacillus iranensis]|uniref:Gluconate 2-dehydrogenase alpha chain n=1 Tax=Alteribacillus iranensis TaxID=930128 RepID=A0A1I2BKP0_9BACI|nr:GMC family oxidoreductase [Alteribacillus iranensis]SFE56487.1 gluconate 2-dehydrogenase alpha chain [Alteribacillus iranensis]